MTPAQFGAAMDRKAAALKRNIIAAEAATVQEAKAELVKRSSGTLSTKTLRKMGHPYGRGLGAGVMRWAGNIDPTIVNAQSKQFKRRWKVTGPTRGGTITSAVYNTDPKAVFMFGTKKMVARRLDSVVARQMKAKRIRRLRAAVRRALRA